MATLGIVSNIPTPYRMDFFDVLSEALRSRGIKLNIAFCAQTEKGRNWDLRSRESAFDWQVLPGVHPRMASTTLHFNSGVNRWVKDVKPRWLLTAGSWFLPAALLARQIVQHQGGDAIFWGEGHSEAVNHPNGPIAFLRRRVLEGFDGFAIPNRRSANFYQEELSPSIKLLRLRNCVDESFYTISNQPKKMFRERKGIRHARTLLLVSSLTPVKGVIEVLQAYKLLSKKDRQRLNIVVVGGGPLMKRAISIAALEEGVYLTGDLRMEEVREYYWASDAFLMNSNYDPNPLSMIEAALSALPLIATKAVGNAEDLITSENGLVLSNGNIQSVLDGFRLLLDFDETQLNRMGLVSRTIAVDSYSRAIVAETFIDDLLQQFPEAR